MQKFLLENILKNLWAMAGACTYWTIHGEATPTLLGAQLLVTILFWVSQSFGCQGQMTEDMCPVSSEPIKIAFSFHLKTLSITVFTVLEVHLLNESSTFPASKEETTHLWFESISLSRVPAYFQFRINWKSFPIGWSTLTNLSLTNLIVITHGYSRSRCCSYIAHVLLKPRTASRRKAQV